MLKLNLPLVIFPVDRAISILLLLATLGCDTGYNIDVAKNNVVFVTWDEGNGRREFPVEGADAKTFEILDLDKRKPFARDKNHVYQRTKCIIGADPSSFRKFGNSYRDDESVFIWVSGELKQLAGSDPDSFEWLKEPNWSRDKSQVFWQNFGFIPRDMDSFELLEGYWAKDNLMFYH